MIKKWIFLSSFVLMISLLSGCNEINEILGKLNDMLDDASEETEDTTNTPSIFEEEDDENKEDTAGQGAINTSNPSTTNDMPFDEKLQSEGYDLKTLPNGFPLEVPYHWILVEDNEDDPNRENFVGTFCFNIPLEIVEIAEQFNDAYTLQQEHYGEDTLPIHRTTIRNEADMMGDWEAVVEYFKDPHANTCADVTIYFNFDGGGEGFAGGDYSNDGEYSGEGEDPSTMVSDEELATSEEIDDEEEENSSIGGQSARVASVDYNELLDELRSYEDLPVINYDLPEIESIEDKIRNGTHPLLHEVNGFPRIFPYEWYLLKKDENFAAGEWTGTYCTDAQVKSTLLKHHKMLAEHNAKIFNFELVASPSMYQISSVEFAFNDEFGTGSWHGNTLMYMDGTQDFQTHKCVNVEMKFSSEFIQ